MIEPIQPNTETSPQQGGVRDILNAATQNAPTTADMMAMNEPSVRAMLKGLASAKGQSDAEKKAREIASAPTPTMTTTTRVDKATGQTVHDVTVTGFQPGNAKNAVQNAYDAPTQDTQKFIEASRSRVEKDYHLDPAGTGGQLPADIAKNKDTFLGRAKLERQAGHGWIGSLANAAAIQVLPDSMENAHATDLANTVDRQRKLTADKYVEKEMPIVQESDRQNRLNAEDRRLGGLDQRDSQRRIRDIIAKTDFDTPGLDSPDARLGSVADQFGVEAQFLPSWVSAQIERKTRQDKESGRSKRITDFRKDRGALGQFSSFEQAKTSLGVPLTKDEEPAAQADWQSAREATVRTRQNDFLHAQAAQRGADTAERIANNATKGRPIDAGKLIRGTLTPETLVSYKDNTRYDQDSVDAAVSAGVEHYSKAINDRVATAAGYNQILASAPDNPTPAEAKRIDKARFEARRLIRANGRDQKALDTLRGAAPQQPSATPAAPAAAAPASHNLGDRKTFPNGNVGEWDGRGWKQVK